MRYLCTLLLLCCGCSNYFIQEYVKDRTCKDIISRNGDYQTRFAFEDCNAPRRALVDEYPVLQKLVHKTLVPDTERFNRVVVFIPENDDSWVAVDQFISEIVDFKKSTAKAFTIPMPEIYVIFRPDYWKNGTDTRIRKTAVHELMHHVAIEVYNDPDIKHKHPEFWSENGLIDQILAAYEKL